MAEIKVGDRVVVDGDSGGQVSNHDKGKVLDVNTSYYLIEFDVPRFTFHSGPDGGGRPGHCWYVDKKMVKLETAQNQTAKYKIGDVVELAGSCQLNFGYGEKTATVFEFSGSGTPHFRTPNGRTCYGYECITGLAKGVAVAPAAPKVLTRSVWSGGTNTYYSCSATEAIAKFGFQEITKENNKEKTIMSDVKSKIKVLAMSADDKALYKAGFIDADGDLTGKGTDALEEVQYQSLRPELVKLAEELNSEDAKEKKAKK